MAARIPKALAGRERTLAERDADPVLVAPHGSAGQMQPISRHNQHESLGDSGLAVYL